VIYQWKPQAILPIAAQAAGEELERIRASRNGRLTTEDTVSEAKAEANPLHPVFDWNDETAGHKWRLEQARYLIRNITITVEKPSGEQVPIRAFVNVQRDEDRSFTSVAQAMSDEDLRAQVVGRAWAELEAWRKRYGELVEFAQLFVAIDKQVARRAA
jgi:hypothetical protein